MKSLHISQIRELGKACDTQQIRLITPHKKPNKTFTSIHYNTLTQERSGGILEYRPRKLKITLPDYSDEDDPRGIDYEPNQYFYHLSEEIASVWVRNVKKQSSGLF